MNFRYRADIRVCPDIRGSLVPIFEPAPATVQSQFAASPTLVALVDAMAVRILPGADINLFFREVFDIMTARGWGLDNWGRILGIGRVLEVADDAVFGFTGSGLQPFDQGNFYVGGVTRAHALTDAAYRELLLIKALANISSADAATLNLLMGKLFPGQPAYVLETGIMSIRFVFQFFLKPYQRAIFSTPGLLTRGAGVGVEWLEVEPQSTFSFAGSNMQPFGQGTFFQGALSIAPPSADTYDLGEFYYFRHPTLKPGFQPAHGGLLYNVPALYPKAWAYLQTVEGQKLCTTESQWQNMVNAVWHTNADGSRVGWNGIGGAPWYVVNTGNGTLRLPDLRGMYAEAGGIDGLGVGGAHGDAGRNITCSFSVRFDSMDAQMGAAYSIPRSGARLDASQTYGDLNHTGINASRQMPVASKFQPRAWGSLACVYLG